MLYQKQTLLEKDLAARDELNQQLMEQWTRQIDALDHANHALQDAQRRLLTEREEERKYIAREIHDLVIQDLLGINYQLEDVAIDNKTISDSNRILSEIRESIQDLVDDLRHICGNLRPPTIDSLGLHDALQSLIDEWSRRTGIEAKLDLERVAGRLPEEIELSVFRIVQEGLNNIRKHSDAKNVEIFLKHTSPRSLIISISDDGKGLPENWDLAYLSLNGHFGLLGISERVVLLGGHLRIENLPEGGLLIEAEITHPKLNDFQGIET